MTLFMKKTWGFSEPCGPLQFSKRGSRENARRDLQPGDRVVIVGTETDDTDPEERGMILGMMEPTTTPVMSLDFSVRRRRQDYNKDGEYKWPFALALHRAWRASPKVRFKEITERNYTMDGVGGIVALTAGESSQVERLSFEPIELLRSVRILGRQIGMEAARRAQTPAPWTTRSGVMHMRRAPAYTYGMRVAGASMSAF